MLFPAITALIGSVAVACPFCKVAGGNLAEDDPNELLKHLLPDSQCCTKPHEESNKLFPLRIGISIDTPTAYFHHGYMQQDRGLIVQPAITFTTQPLKYDGWVIEPYFSWWNSIHSESSPGYAGGHGSHTKVEQQYQEYLDAPHAGSPLPHYHTRLVDVIVLDDTGGGWFETELMPGVLMIKDPLRIDLQFKAGIYPSDFHDTKLEIGGKFTYDAASIWNKDSHRDFSLYLGTSFNHEIKDDAGSAETVIEPSIEPVWRTKLMGQRVAISMPITLGLTPNGYYRHTSNQHQMLGYLATAVKVSIELPVKEKVGQWFLNISVTENHLFADSAIFANGGEKDAIVGTIGIGVAF